MRVRVCNWEPQFARVQTGVVVVAVQRSQTTPFTSMYDSCPQDAFAPWVETATNTGPLGNLTNIWAPVTTVFIGGPRLLQYRYPLISAVLCFPPVFTCTTLHSARQTNNPNTSAHLICILMCDLWSVENCESVYFWSVEKQLHTENNFSCVGWKQPTPSIGRLSAAFFLRAQQFF